MCHLSKGSDFAAGEELVPFCDYLTTVYHTSVMLLAISMHISLYCGHYAASYSLIPRFLCGVRGHPAQEPGNQTICSYFLSNGLFGSLTGCI